MKGPTAPTPTARPNWIGGQLTAEEEARVAALLAEEDGADGADGAAHLAAPGCGYEHAQEHAARLNEIDELLLAFGRGSDAASSAGGASVSNMGETAAEAQAGPSVDYLDEMKAQRAEARLLEDVRDGLARLHATSLTEAASETEEEELRGLLQQVRSEAEERANASLSPQPEQRASVPFQPRDID